MSMGGKLLSPPGQGRCAVRWYGRAASNVGAAVTVCTSVHESLTPATMQPLSICAVRSQVTALPVFATTVLDWKNEVVFGAVNLTPYPFIANTLLMISNE